MIDYVKLKIYDCNIGHLLAHPELEFKTTVSEKTGLLDTKKVCLYRHCKIMIYDSGIIIFQGSIHKLYNSITGIFAPNKNSKNKYRGFNGNQFKYKEIDFVRKHLESLFEVPPNQMIFQNVEYGQNLRTPFNPQLFIKGLLLFMGKKFDYDFNDYYAQSKHSQYIIKIYNKGNQYGMDSNVLRIEIKATKMQCQKKEVGIITMADISLVTMDKAFNYLQKILDKVLYYDNSINEVLLSRVEKNRIKEYSNPRYWEKLKSTKRDTKKKHLYEIIKNNSNNLKEELQELLKENRVTFYRDFKDEERVIVYPSNIVESITPMCKTKYSITGHAIPENKFDTLKQTSEGIKLKFSEHNQLRN